MLTENKPSSEKEQITAFFTKLLKEVESSYSYTIPYAFLGVAVVRLQLLFEFSPFVIDHRVFTSFLAFFTIIFLLQLNYFINHKVRLSFKQLLLYILVIAIFNFLINSVFTVIFTDNIIEIKTFVSYILFNVLYGFPSYIATKYLLRLKAKML